jgi:hypothetical protein
LISRAVAADIIIAQSGQPDHAISPTGEHFVAVLDLIARELEIEPVGDWTDAPSIRGRDGTWEFFVTGDDRWESSPYEIPACRRG